MKGKEKVVGINSEQKGRKTENGHFVSNRVLQFVGMYGTLKKETWKFIWNGRFRPVKLTYEQMSGEAGKLFFEETEDQKDCAKPSK